tara:strand:- start:2731 stop:3951 length:1221 start_codon:yes stop_codon:yes gene_type:complete
VPVNLPQLERLEAVPGVAVGTARAAIKYADRDDLVVLALGPDTRAAGVFTQSDFRAAPVEIAVEHLDEVAPRALVINSGNANAATGVPGRADAMAVCAAVARSLGLQPAEVLPFSTGVIGERLPVAQMEGAAAEAVAGLSDHGWEAAARAILTTDTGPKALSRTVTVQGVDVHVTGMAKGAGMIKPDMATMLAFVCCDANVTTECLQTMVRELADASFNRITVDGDTSTNDAFLLCATGAADHALVSGPEDAGYQELREGLGSVATKLAQRIVRDGEGATRFVTVRVCGGADAAESLAVAYTVAESPLVKTALFAGDPNWGRFCMAIGRSGIESLDTTRVDLFLDDVCVARGGLVDMAYDEAEAAVVMAREEFEVRIELGRGAAEEVVWTTDLSYEYVRINAEYRT